MTKIITTNINLEDEIRTIKALEAKLEELKELKEEKEAEIKKLLDNAGLEELQVGAFTIRFTNVVRNNFNTSAFKKKYIDTYSYLKKQGFSSNDGVHYTEETYVYLKDCVENYIRLKSIGDNRDKYEQLRRINK